MTIEDDIFFLERLTIFGQLGFSALQILAIGSEARELAPGEVLFPAGDAADGGYIIQVGALRLDLPGADPAAQDICRAGHAARRARAGDGDQAPGHRDRDRAVDRDAGEPSLFRKVLEGFPMPPG